MNALVVRVKGKVYKTVVKPAMIYDAETWTMETAHAKKLEAEMRMLRLMSGVTNLDIIRNERIRGRSQLSTFSQ